MRLGRTNGVHCNLYPIAQGIPLDQGVAMKIGPTSITAIHLFFADEWCASLRIALVAAQACYDTVFESKDTVILKPEEHDLLEIRLCCREETL